MLCAGCVHERGRLLKYSEPVKQLDKKGQVSSAEAALLPGCVREIKATDRKNKTSTIQSVAFPGDNTHLSVEPQLTHSAGVGLSLQRRDLPKAGANQSFVDVIHLEQMRHTS